MELSETQKEMVRQWVQEGCSLADVQRRIDEEFDMAMTYMDVRFLVLDLDVDIHEPESARKPRQTEMDETAPSAQAQPVEDTAVEEPEVIPPAGDAPAGNVTVELDRLIKPGAIVSGTVTFSDGVTGTWMLDQLGRLAIEPSQPGYRPSDSDNEAFVKALQAEVAKKGF
jgi:hypothetical protein